MPTKKKGNKNKAPAVMLKPPKEISIFIPIKPSVHGPSPAPDEFMLLSLEIAVRKFLQKYPDWKFCAGGTDRNFLHDPRSSFIAHSDATSSRTEAIRKMRGRYIFLTGADHTYDEDVLINLFEEDKDIVDGPTVKSQEPYDPAFGWLSSSGRLRWAVYGFDYDDEDVNSGSLIKVDFSGLAAALIKRRVIEEIDTEEFSFLFQRIQIPVIPDNFYSHDISFCFRAKAAGFDHYMKMNCCVRHDTRLGYMWLNNHIDKVKHDPQFQSWFRDDILEYGLVPRSTQRINIVKEGEDER